MVQNTSSKISNDTICVVGLGYVGLPLALAFGRTDIPTYGFDIKPQRINELKNGIDGTGELTAEELASSSLKYSNDESVVQKANFVIVAVPTPVDKANVPDLTLLKKASELVGRNLRSGSIIVYESTVYPGATEEVCAPILELTSGLKLGRDFKIGYSPERINPGDKEHTLERIVKVVSGMDKISTKRIAEMYGYVCAAGVHVAPNIKTAEAAKVIENTQRDLNIALMNELSLIFHRLDINTRDVLNAAGTKWNFLKFTPGLVGGHCIGVDPYYLVHKAEELGYHPEIIAAGRRVNDHMPEFVAQEIIRGLIETNKRVTGAKILILGLTFKENVTDVRNSKIASTINYLKKFNAKIYGYDPLLSAEDITNEFAIKPLKRLTGKFDAIIIAQNHAQFAANLPFAVPSLANEKMVVFDIKGQYGSLADAAECTYMSL